MAFAVGINLILLVFIPTVFFLFGGGDFSAPIGDAQMKLLRSYEKASQVNYYMEESTRLAVRDALVLFGARGGESADAPLEEGYARWYTEGAAVYTDAVQPSFSDAVDLTPYLAEYLLVPPSSVVLESFTMVDAQSGEERILLRGTTSAPVYLHHEQDFERGYRLVQSGKHPFYTYTPSASKELVLQKIDTAYRSIIEEERARLQSFVETELVLAYIAQESAGDPFAISPTGCAGLLQFCYATFKEYSPQSKATPCCKGAPCRILDTQKSLPLSWSPEDHYLCSPQTDDRFDVRTSVAAGIKLIEKNMNTYTKRGFSKSNVIALSAGAYNAGQGIIDPLIKKTGKEDPSWEDILLIFEDDDVTYGWLSDNPQGRKEKRMEISGYAPGIIAYYERFKGETHAIS